jgi:chromate transporter
VSGLVQLLAVFGLLSLLAVGGGLAVLPEMKSLTVVRHGWITADQFVDYYSLGQMAPGPNMNMVLLVGYRVAGVAGALFALAAFYVPASLLALAAGRAWRRLEAWPWRESVRRGLAPVTVGLMTAGVISLARVGLVDARAVALAVAVAAVLLTRPVNPALLILGSGAVAWVAFR